MADLVNMHKYLGFLPLNDPGPSLPKGPED